MAATKTKKTNPLVRLLFGGRIHEPGRPKKVGRWDLMNRIAWYHVWADVFTTNTQMRDSRTFPERDYNLYTNNRASFSGKDNLVVFLSFDGYSTTLPMRFRAEMRKRLHPTMRMFFTDYSIPTAINWEDPKLKALLRNYQNTAEENKGLGDNAFEYQKNATDLARDQWREESIVYLSNATSADRQLEFFEYRCHAIVMGIRGEDFDESLEKIEQFCTRNGITVNRVVQHLADFTAAFSPFSMDHSRKSFGRVGKNVLSDEIIARFTGYGLYDREFVDILKDIGDIQPFFKAVVSEYGIDLDIVQYDQAQSVRGKSNFNFRRNYDFAMQGITSSTKLLMRLATYIAALVGVVCLGIAIFVFVNKIVNWNNYGVGEASTAIGIFFLGSIQLFFIGILGEYILSINGRITRKPRVVVGERINFADESHGNAQRGDERE